MPARDPLLRRRESNVFFISGSSRQLHIQLNWATSSKLLPPPHLVWAPSRLSVTDNNLTGPSRNAHFSHHLHYPPHPTPPPAPPFLPPGNSHWDAGYLEKKNSERITLSFIHRRSRGIPANFLLYCDGSGVEEPKDFKEF